MKIIFFRISIVRISDIELTHDYLYVQQALDAFSSFILKGISTQTSPNNCPQSTTVGICIMNQPTNQRLHSVGFKNLNVRHKTKFIYRLSEIWLCPK